MEVRKDLLEVEGLFHRLLAIGSSFSKNIDYWSHLKNKEDFRNISLIPFEVRHLVEAVYADGRDMAQYMAWTIGDTNEDYAEYPTLTSIVENLMEAGCMVLTIPTSLKLRKLLVLNITKICGL